MKLLWLLPTRLQKWLTLVGVVFCSCLAAAAELDPNVPLSNYGIDVWDSSDGLSQFRIRALKQTRDGYLWLGTASGLVRFDGVSFTTFDISTGSLKDNEVSALVEDAAGALWIGTYAGGVTRLQGGQFTSFTTAEGLPDDSIRRMVLDGAGNLWMATPRGVARLKDGQFKNFTTAEGLPENFITAISPAVPQGVYVTAGGRLSRFVEGRFEPVAGVIEEGDGRIDSMTTGRGGELWLTFESGRIKCWKDGRLTTYTPSEHHRDRAGAVYEDPQGSIWFAAHDSLLRLANGRFETLSTVESKSNLGLVLSFQADAEGNLWVGTEACGLARLRGMSVRLLTVQDGLPENSTRCIFRDRQGDVWIGTYQGYARLRGDQFTAFKQGDGIALPAVTALNEDAAGRLWLAVGGQLFVRAGDRLTPVPGWQKVYDIKAITPDRNGHMWVGTDGNGLFEIADDGIKAYRVTDGLANDQIRAILCDHEGAVWVGTTDGLSRIQGGRITTFRVADGLANNRVMSLHEDAGGELWISTRAGLSRRAGGKFFNYREPQGLPDSFIYNVLDDQRGSFWLTTGKGIYRVSCASLKALAAGQARQLEVTLVGYREGLRSASLVAGTQPNACLAPDGRLLFCSLKGVVCVDPGAKTVNLRPPPVHIETLTLNRQAHPADRLVEIPPSPGEVEIHYTALSYVAPENVRFKYRLEGIDADWVDAGTRRYAYYASLPPGLYRFQVQACNNDGLWNENGATCSFRLLPHLYQRAWFWPSIVLLAAGLAAGVFWFRLRRHRQRERDLQRRVDEAVARVKVLSGLLPICAGCKKIRDDRGYWGQIESYIMRYADVSFSHGLCPDCLRETYPDLADEVIKELEISHPPHPPKHEPPPPAGTR